MHLVQSNVLWESLEERKARGGYACCGSSRKIVSKGNSVETLVCQGGRWGSKGYRYTLLAAYLRAMREGRFLGELGLWF